MRRTSPLHILVIAEQHTIKVTDRLCAYQFGCLSQHSLLHWYFLFGPRHRWQRTLRGTMRSSSPLVLWCCRRYSTSSVR